MRRLTAPPEPPADLAAGLAAIREELDVPGDFPPGALREAEEAARAPLPPREDRRDIELFTIDPVGSMDLDQAMALARRAEGGYRVDYAIADVAAFVTPGGELDAEAHRRVVTRYLPDGNAPLHPRVLSEGAASLLPGRTARRTCGRSRSSPTARRRCWASGRRSCAAASGSTTPACRRGSMPDGRRAPALLQEIGGLLQERERARGAINLPIPDQEVVLRDGAYELAYRGPLPIEDWNAQISLLTGMAAAELMLSRGAGLLRTLPAAPPHQLERLRRVADALGIVWPRDEPVGDLIRRLDPRRPREAALLEEAATLLRGAGYVAFDGQPPADARHAGVAAHYSHVTAPLRRLADRYATEAPASTERRLLECARCPPRWRPAGAARPRSSARASTSSRRSCSLRTSASASRRWRSTAWATMPSRSSSPNRPCARAATVTVSSPARR